MSDIRKIAVIGAGLMGRGIAHIAATGGYDVALRDLDDGLLKVAMDTIGANMRGGVERGKMTAAESSAAFARLDPVTDLAEAVRDADMVIEAVPEKIDLKLPLFAELDRLCPPETIFVTNTSALSVTEMAGATKRPDRVVSMHFFNPAHVMKLCEINRGLETSDQTVEAALAVAKRMGKETIVAKESPGFVVTRINVLIGNEAWHLLEEGISTPEDIDKALRLGLNLPMGPFELGDFVGWDTRWGAQTYLHQTLGDKYRPTTLFLKYMRAGRFGKKTGKGVWEYDETGNRLGPAKIL
jgi:3-hydroxybutyryl-CoA dehydrogenase